MNAIRWVDVILSGSAVTRSLGLGWSLPVGAGYLLARPNRPRRSASSRPALTLDYLQRRLIRLGGGVGSGSIAAADVADRWCSRGCLGATAAWGKRPPAKVMTTASAYTGFCFSGRPFHVMPRPNHRRSQEEVTNRRRESPGIRRRRGVAVRDRWQQRIGTRLPDDDPAAHPRRMHIQEAVRGWNASRTVRRVDELKIDQFSVCGFKRSSQRWRPRRPREEFAIPGSVEVGC